MPISGMKKGNRVITPSGRNATVVDVIGSLSVKIRYDDDRTMRVMRQSALRLIEPWYHEAGPATRALFKGEQYEGDQPND